MEATVMGLYGDIIGIFGYSQSFRVAGFEEFGESGLRGAGLEEFEVFGGVGSGV